jgi:hypothetical protein
LEEEEAGVKKRELAVAVAVGALAPAVVKKI